MFEGLLRPTHLLVLLVIVLLLFPKNLGKLGKGLGDCITGFKEAFKGSSDGEAKADAAKDTKA